MMRSRRAPTAIQRSEPVYDVVIVGAGFSGSLLAWILASRGRRVLLVDRAVHPRFAIGESSTPLADLILRQLADRYQLDGVAALANYGRWKNEHPELTCGCKRGFSYFKHVRNQSFHESEAHEASLLVAASRSTEVADTHWLRSDVDQFFCQQAVAAGAEYRDATEAELLSGEVPWRLNLKPCDSAAKQSSTPDVKAVTARFLVGAAGRDGDLFAPLGVRDHVDELLTQTQSTFGHFSHMQSWSGWLEQHGFQDAYRPFDADQAAQHHLLENGWLWMLRMDDGRTSVGWTRPLGSNRTPDDPSLLARLGLTCYPSLLEIFRDARCIAPTTGLIQSGRLQRLRRPMVGDGWALMPTAAVTIDPLHSGGIAHGLAGVERLASVLLDSGGIRQQRARLQRYQADVLAEARLLDCMIAMSYQAMHDFSLFAATTMVYFAGAIACEERRGAGEIPPRLWSADDEGFVEVVHRAFQRVARLTQDHTRRIGCDAKDSAATDAFVRWIRAELAPWNSAGLLDEAVRNRYRYTAADK